LTFDLEIVRVMLGIKNLNLCDISFLCYEHCVDVMMLCV